MKLITLENNIQDELTQRYYYEALGTLPELHFDDYLTISFQPMTYDKLLNGTITVEVYDTDNIVVGFKSNGYYYDAPTTYSNYMDIVDACYNFLNV